MYLSRVCMTHTRPAVRLWPQAFSPGPALGRPQSAGRDNARSRQRRQCPVDGDCRVFIAASHGQSVSKRAREVIVMTNRSDAVFQRPVDPLRLEFSPPLERPRMERDSTQRQQLPIPNVRRLPRREHALWPLVHPQPHRAERLRRLP